MQSRSRGGGCRPAGISTSSASDYGPGLSHLPQNFVYNAGDNVVFRRLTSTFLSPLATAYLLVVAMFFIPLLDGAGGFRSACCCSPRSWWTHTRAAGDRSRLRASSCSRSSGAACSFLGWAAVVVLVAFGFVKGYDHFAPRTHFTAAEQVVQERNGSGSPNVSHDPTAAGESSTSEHLVEPARRREDGAEASVGLRARQCGGDCASDSRDDRGGRVDLHGARGRDRAPRRARLHRLGRCRCCAECSGATRGSELRSLRCSCSDCRRT